jgi:hypothetical protein
MLRSASCLVSTMKVKRGGTRDKTLLLSWSVETQKLTKQTLNGSKLFALHLKH